MASYSYKLKHILNTTKIKVSSVVVVRCYLLCVTAFPRLLYLRRYL